MKYPFTILSLFVFSLFYSQKYHFNYFVQMKNGDIETSPTNRILTRFYDSKNEIMLYLEKRSETDVEAFFIDRNTKKVHSFKVTSKDAKMRFDYLYSENFDRRELQNDQVVKVNKIDDLNYEMVVYKNATLKRKLATVLVKLEKSNNMNYINFMTEIIDGNKLKKALENVLGNETYILKDQIWDDRTSSGKFLSRVEYIEAVDLNLEVPEKMISKK